MTSIDNEFLNKLSIARDSLAEQFLGQPDVSLIDIGLDPEAGDDSKQIGIRVHLRKGSAKEVLDIPSEIDGIPVFLVIADYQLERGSAAQLTGGEMKANSNKVLDDHSADKDDFQQIKGIGPVTAQALYDIGIYRFTDLVSYTSLDRIAGLVEMLESDVKFISKERIIQEDWHSQAKKLTISLNRKELSKPTVDKFLTTIPKMQEHPNQKPSTEEDDIEWRELADFFVSFGEEIGSSGEARFKTKVHHSQTDKFDQWYGIAIDQLIKWMMEETNLTPQKVDKEIVEATPLVESFQLKTVDNKTHILLTDLWVYQIELQTLVNGKLQTGLVRVDSSFNISGPDAVNLTYERIPFIVEVYIVNTQSNQSELVATERGQLSPEDLKYDIKHEFPVPPHGRYQLYVLGRLLLPTIEAANLQGPIIRVET